MGQNNKRTRRWKTGQNARGEVDCLLVDLMCKEGLRGLLWPEYGKASKRGKSQAGNFFGKRPRDTSSGRKEEMSSCTVNGG